MKLVIAIATATFTAASALGQAKTDFARWQAESVAVSITRDDWGIAHIHGKTDADAVFGTIYAQCEDDFNRVETNYLTALGRTAEAEGEKALWADLRQKIFVDPTELQRLYVGSPAWLRTLMDAWADGLNFYLAKHPETRPRVIKHFEPWMALSFTEGSIGGDIERVDLTKLAAFYGGREANSRPAVAQSSFESEPRGSNGAAIAPQNTVNHHALLLINPHTSFFFRSELQMSSDSGLNAYGAVTWGQFFIYQGFNEHAGWMHTSSGVDAVDEFTENVLEAADHTTSTKYGTETRPVIDRSIDVPYSTPNGLAHKTYVVHYTTHGPVVRADQGKWVSIKLMNIPVPALEQSYLRTKAHTYAEYSKTMDLQANSSNNTIFADSDGDIAYWHGNFIPRRDPRFDFTGSVDGSDPATDWHGLLSEAEVPYLHNPASGFLFNVNNSPWNGAGSSSLRKSDFPPYVEQGIESARGIHADRVFNHRSDFTLDSLVAAAFDSALPWFDRTLPALFTAYDSLPKASPMRIRLEAQIVSLRDWDRRWSGTSVPTSLAIFWATELLKTASPQAHQALMPSEDFVASKTAPKALLDALASASDRLAADFGSWRTPWGTINRFQRLTGDLIQPFSDASPSIPVPFASATWGTLASFGAHAWPGTKKWYGTVGNSFVAVVEFGPRVRARAITAGGESGHPGTSHFNDEAMRYAHGNLREVYFYPDQLKGHTERQYRPGD